MTDDQRRSLMQVKDRLVEVFNILDKLGSLPRPLGMITQSIKFQLSAIQQLLDYLVIGG